MVHFCILGNRTADSTGCTHTHNETAALSLSVYHFLLLSTRLLPPSVYSIVLHAPVDSSCRASTFHIITTSDVCGPEEC